MRLAPLLAALTLIGSQTSAQTTVQAATGPSQLVGTWESIDRQGGQGSIMVFAPDNSMVAIVSALIDGRYTRNGNRVRFTDVEGMRGDVTVVVTGNTLVQSKGRNSITMTRVPGHGPDTGIVGKWRYPYEVAPGRTLQATTEYTTDGVVRLRLPLQALAGSYSVSGNQLTLRIPNTPPQTGPFSIEGNVLILQRPDGAIARLARTR